MSRLLFWLSDEAWAAIEPHLPKNQQRAHRVDGRTGDLRDHSHAQMRGTMDGLPHRIRPPDGRL